jgi:hypothetical protein
MKNLRKVGGRCYWKWAEAVGRNAGKKQGAKKKYGGVHGMAYPPVERGLLQKHGTIDSSNAGAHHAL